jgi:alkanesulfonate monooxygenase SsuD/methylene tetrahydromethanopterin reductase-like flavin-dependent oxidoreductase (luciferase family)
MRFSMQLWTQRDQESDPLWPQHLDRQLKLLEEYGFWSAIALNHYLGGLQALQPSAVLGWAAARTTTLRLGTGIVILPLLNPVYVAETWASLDVLSSGRVFLGVGLGYREEEFHSFGVNRSDRVGRLVESIEAIRALWTGEKVDYHGKHFDLDGVRLGNLPVQQSLPIWIGAAVEPSILRAAEMGDGWLIPPDCKPRRLASMLDLHHARRQELGLNPGEYPLERQLFLTEDPEREFETMVPYIAHEWSRYADRGLEWFKRRFDDLIEKAFLVCTPEECVERLRMYESMGIEHVVFRTHWGGMPLERAAETVRLFGEKVMPQFADRAPAGV